MTGPSPHLSWNELSCVNRTGKVWHGFAPGEVIAEYPPEWEDRAVELAATFEDIRAIFGGPLIVTSAYRTKEYNAAIGGARKSQHCEGRALDIKHPRVHPMELFNAIRRLHKAGDLPFLGGMGGYTTFVHLDVREHVPGKLTVWMGQAEAA